MNNSTLSSTLAVIILGAAIAAPVSAQTSAAGTTPPAAIVASYQQMDRGAAQRNPNPILSSYTPNAVFIDPKGKTMPAAMMNSRVHDAIIGAQSSASTTQVKSAEVQSDGVTVTIHRHINETDITPKTQVLNTTVIDYTERDHWIQVSGKWKINRERLISGSMMINGKPFTGTM